VTAPPGPPGPTDAELVARVLAADREAFATVYDRYGPRLYDFAYSMLRHREDAADTVADSFVLFAERLPQLRDPDRLRPWLYAIVRSECLRRLKARKRVAYDAEEQLIEMADEATGPEAAAERAAQEAYLRQLVWDASAGLADRDRAILDLHLRQGLEGAELGEAIGVTANNAYVMLSRLRSQVDRSLGALLIARLGRDDCEELDALLAGWDGGFSPLVRKRVARHVDGCDVCDERRRTLVSPWMLLAGVPLFAAPLALRDRVLGDTELVAHRGPGADGSVEWLDGGAAATTGGHRWGGGRVTMAAVALLVLAVLGTVLLWPDTEAAPTVAGPTASGPAGPTASPQESPTPTATTSPDETPTPSPSASATPSLLPGELTVSTRSIDLGRNRSQASFGLANTGEQPVVFAVSSRTRWLRLSSIGGSVSGGGTSEVSLSADRRGLREGRSTGTVVVSWDGGRTTVRVTLVEEHAPVVGAPSVPANSSCDVTVTVRVTDESSLGPVTLAWTGPQSGRVRLSRNGSLWSGVVHVSIGGSYTFTATATDVRGNTASGPSTIAAVNPCPQ
jgi:RNA polymerase sigma factor (sigma-70 family)